MSLASAARRSFLAAVPTLFLLAAIPVLAQDAELKPNPVIETLKAACVTVKGNQGSGSGFAIVRGDDTYILTAAHVVDDLRSESDKPDGKGKKIEFADATVLQKSTQDGRIVAEKSWDAEVVKYSQVEDLALLKLREKKAFAVGLSLYVPLTAPPLGTEVLHCGSPLGDIGAQSVIPGFYSAVGRLLEKKIYDQLSCNAFPGSSGGAVALKSDGRVLGIIVRGANGGFILTVPSRRIHAWASKPAVKLTWLFDAKAAAKIEGTLEDH